MEAWPGAGTEWGLRSSFYTRKSHRYSLCPASGSQCSGVQMGFSTDHVRSSFSMILHRHLAICSKNATLSDFLSAFMQCDSLRHIIKVHLHLRSWALSHKLLLCPHTRYIFFSVANTLNACNRYNISYNLQQFLGNLW